jgi:hypothetical protein
MSVDLDIDLPAHGDISAAFAEPVNIGGAPLASSVAPREADKTLVRVLVTTTDLNGMPIQQIAVGDSFLLNVHVEDARADGQGVFSTYLDVLYESGLVAIDGTIQHSDVYSAAPRGDTETPGRINEAGSFSPSIRPVGKGSLLLFSIPMRAVAAGTTLLAADPAECQPMSDLGVYGMDSPVALTSVVFGQTTLQIGERSDLLPANVDELAEAAPDRCTMNVFQPSGESFNDPTGIVPDDIDSDSQLSDFRPTAIDHLDAGDLTLRMFEGQFTLFNGNEDSLFARVAGKIDQQWSAGSAAIFTIDLNDASAKLDRAISGDAQDADRRLSRPSATASFPAADSSFTTPIATSTPSTSQPYEDMDFELPPDENLESSYAIFAQLAEMFPLP